MKTKICFRSWSVFVCFLAAGLLVARGTTVTNEDLGTALTSGASWFGGVAPSTTSIAVWDTNITSANPGNATSALGAAASWEGIQILNPAEPITISADGNALTLGSAGVDMGLATNSLTLNCLVTLGASQNWLVTNGQTLTAGGVISGSGTLTINSTNSSTNGTVILSVANTLSGGTVINGGVVVPGNASSFSSSGTVTMNGGTLLLSTLAASGIIPNAFTVNGPIAIDMFNRNTSEVLDGSFAGSGTIVVTNQTGSGSTLTFGGNGNSGGNMNSFTGSIVIATNASGTPSAGTVRLNNGGSIANNSGNAAMSVNLGTNSSIKFANRASGTTSIGELTGGPGTLLVGPTGGAGTATWSIGAKNTSVTFAGSISNNAANEIAALTKVGTGTFTLTGTNPFTGATVVSAGALQIGDGGTDGLLTGTSGVSVASGASFIFNRAGSYNVTYNISGSGATIVMGGGTNNYSGSSSASGLTTITNADLVLTGSGHLAGPVFVAGNGTLDVSQLGSGFTLNQALSGMGTLTNSAAVLAASGSDLSPGAANQAGTLTIAGGLTENGGVNNQFTLSSPAGTNDLIAVQGSLVLSGTNSITLGEFNAGVIPVGTYPLITYTGTLTGGANNFSLSAVGVTGVVTNITSTTPNEIAVIISPASRAATNLTWVGDGVNNFWDTSSMGDWEAGSTFFTFQSGDSVYFTDTGAPNTNVALQTTVLPAAVVVSNSILQHYTFTDNGTGLGNLSGSTGLTKANTGTLTILNTNTYTGQTIVSGGTLEVMNVVNGGAASPFGAASSDPSNLVFSAGTFQYSGASAAMDRGITNLGGVTIDVTNSATTLTENGPITGTGALIKTGLGTLALANFGSYAGGTVISNGVLSAATQTANASGFGPTSSPITFFGGTLALDNHSSDDGSTVFSFSNPLVVPAGQTGTLEVFERGNEGGTLTGAGTLNVSALGQRAGFSGDWSAFTGTINITGNFRIATTTGYSNAVLQLNGGADLDGGSDAGTYSTSPTFDIGELDATNTSTLATLGAVSKPTPFPTWRVGWKNTTSLFIGTIENPALGVASITKVGTGAWYLGGQNTFSGSTVVSNGTLGLTNATGSDGSIADTTNIFINTGAFLDVSSLNSPSLYLTSSQTLSGNGTVRGNIDTTQGGTIAPGGVVGGTGTLTATNSVNLGGNLVMKLNYPSSDKLVAGGAGGMSLGGTLTVTNVGGSIPPNAVFTLLSASTFNSTSFSGINLPNYYTWDTSQLAVNGTIKVLAVLTGPGISSADFSQLANGSLTLNATNGAPGGEVVVLSSTNVASPVSEWTPVITNNFDGNGNLNTSITVNPAALQEFFIIEGF